MNQLSVHKTSDASLQLVTSEGYKNFAFDAVIGDDVSQTDLFRSLWIFTFHWLSSYWFQLMLLMSWNGAYQGTMDVSLLTDRLEAVRLTRCLETSLLLTDNYRNLWVVYWNNAFTEWVGYLGWNYTESIQASFWIVRRATRSRTLKSVGIWMQMLFLRNLQWDNNRPPKSSKEESTR